MSEAPTAVHHALADARRARLVEALRGAPAGRDVESLASAVGLHPNTVRWHLGVLADAGLVESRRARRSSPGRPRILYRLTREARSSGSDEHRLLATILTGALADLEGGSERAEEAGRAWGRYLVRRPPHLPVPENAVGEVIGLLDEQGFEPEASGREIGMRRCPFHDLAESHPEVVCAVHRGVIDGALEELGSDLAVERLDVLVRQDLCVARLDRR
jgi:predicted ArsR family transcriptional regulator